MKIQKLALPLFAAFSLPMLSVTVEAQSSSPVMKDISGCMQITAEAAKLACYQKLEAEARMQPARAEPLAQPAARAVDGNKSAAAAVGNRENAGAEKQAPAAEKTDFRPASSQTLDFHDEIVEVKEREPNRLLITLANGQVWYQSNSQNFRLRKGMAVHIYPSPLRGSYRLTRDDGTETGFIQVDRVK